MTQVDTPDYQYGVVSAQKLLATVPDTETSVTVGVPPNAETIVVLAPGSLNPADFTCKGATSGLDYPPVPYGPSETGANTTSIVFDVSAAVDSSVTITYGFPAAFVWYVYSDSAAHVHTNAYLARTQNQAGNAAPVDALQIGGTDGTDLRAIRTDTNGQQFTVPAPPGTGTGDHPPVELSTAYVYNGTGGNVLVAAPGAGKRIRLFFVQLIAAISGSVAYLQNGAADRLYAYGTSQGMTAKVPLAGIPVPANDSLVAHISSGNVYCTVMYTIETV